MLAGKIARHALALLATLLVGGLLAATLVRFAPGFDVDEQQLDPHLSAESMQALRAARLQDRNIFRFYLHYMNRAVHGDLGTSVCPGTASAHALAGTRAVDPAVVGIGLSLAWAAAMALALTRRLAAHFRLRCVDHDG